MFTKYLNLMYCIYKYSTKKAVLFIFNSYFCEQVKQGK